MLCAPVDRFEEKHPRYVGFPRAAAASRNHSTAQIVMSGRRPELEVPAEIYYGDDNARKYHISSRVQDIQRRMTERALELLCLPPEEKCLILDLGSGTGIAGEVLQAAGHTWVGTDISRNMLQIAKKREFEATQRYDDDDDDDNDAEDDDGEAVAGSSDDAEEGGEDEAEDVNPRALGRRQKAPLKYDVDDIEGPEPVEVMKHDMGTPIPFRPGTFDGCISISALQWLCNIDRKGQIPQRRLKDLFQSLFNSLRRGARAVFQFYPANTHQTAMISTIATRCGFGGGVIVDYPHSSRARKYYLVIYAGLAPAGYRPPRPLGEEEDPALAVGSDEDDDEDDEAYFHNDDEETPADGGGDKIKMFPREKKRVQKLTGHRPERAGARPKAGSKAWVLLKKEQRRKFGEETRTDSKYTARKRPSKW
jgi:18S rRNA (guanine1575-N7)-methyltransferase